MESRVQTLSIGAWQGEPMGVYFENFRERELPCTVKAKVSISLKNLFKTAWILKWIYTTGSQVWEQSADRAMYNGGASMKNPFFLVPFQG